MPRNGSGTQTSPAASYPAVSGTLIESGKFNAVINDINASLTASIANDGQTPILANLPMSGFKHTGAAAASASGQYAEYDQMNTAISSAVSSLVPTGTKMLFMQASAPTGWTEDSTTFAGRSLYIKDGTHAGATTGGSHNPLLMDVVPSHTHAFTTGSDGSHVHDINYKSSGSVSNGSGLLRGTDTDGTSSSFVSSSGAHTHTGTTNANGSASNWTPKYAVAIVCTNN